MNNRARLVSILFICIVLFIFWSPPQPRTPAIKKQEPEKQSAQETADTKVVVEKRPERKPHACPETFFSAIDILSHQLCDFGHGKYDLWLVINENVYDVSDWAPYHPGGMLICHGAGFDATKLFKSSHQDWVSQNELPKWCIGKLQSGELDGLKQKDKHNK